MIHEHNKNLTNWLTEDKTAGTVQVYEKDCSRCKNFETTPLNHPSGYCKNHEKFCGVGLTCDDFK